MEKRRGRPGARGGVMSCDIRTEAHSRATIYAVWDGAKTPHSYPPSLITIHRNCGKRRAPTASQLGDVGPV